MIGFFPEPYEDELCYSVLARYFSKSGYVCYSSAAEDLLVNPKCKPSIEFCNLLTEDAISQIGSIKDFVVNHTMLNYYAAFLPCDKKDDTYSLAFEMDIKSLMNALPVPKNRQSRYLRYCCVCVKEDRENLGETYWHRAHQLYGVTACYKHGCKLIDSDVPITSCASPSVITAESGVDKVFDIETRALPVEIDIAKYIFEILKTNINSKTSVATHIKDRLSETAYISARGAKRYIRKLSLDFKRHFKDVCLYGFGEEWQIEKVLNGDRANPFEICLLGMFLGIQANELASRGKRRTQRNTEQFDNRIKELKSQGLNYREIAYQIGISYDYCKLLGNRKDIKKHNTVTRSGGKRVDWEVLDEITLPKVIKLVTELSITGVRRPQRISVGKIEQMAGLKECQLRRMPKCLEYVKAHMISQEEFWAQVIVWAIEKLIVENKTINLTNIMKVSNLRKESIKAALPFVEQYPRMEIRNYMLENTFS